MLSFPEAISESAVLIHKLEENPQLDVSEELSAILSSSEGARGFLVSLLTENWRFGDHIPSILINGLKNSKEITFDLLVKNLVMSTTMRVTHERNKNHEQAQGSVRVARRTKYIISNITDTDLDAKLTSMQAATLSCLEMGVDEDEPPRDDAKAEEFVAFLRRWKYDADQLNAANDALKQSIATRL